MNTLGRRELIISEKGKEYRLVIRKEEGRLIADWAPVSMHSIGLKEPADRQAIAGIITRQLSFFKVEESRDNGADVKE